MAARLVEAGVQGLGVVLGRLGAVIRRPVGRGLDLGLLHLGLRRGRGHVGLEITFGRLDLLAAVAEHLGQHAWHLLVHPLLVDLGHGVREGAAEGAAEFEDLRHAVALEQVTEAWYPRLEVDSRDVPGVARSVAHGAVELAEEQARVPENVQQMGLFVAPAESCLALAVFALLAGEADDGPEGAILELADQVAHVVAAGLDAQLEVAHHGLT